MSFTHSQVIPDLYVFVSSGKHEMRYSKACACCSFPYNKSEWQKLCSPYVPSQLKPLNRLCEKQTEIRAIGHQKHENQMSFVNSFFFFEVVCIRLTWHLHNPDMSYVMNMKEVLCMFVRTVIKCHSLNYDILNANLTLFEMSLLWHLDITKTTQPVINMT